MQDSRNLSCSSAEAEAALPRFSILVFSSGLILLSDMMSVDYCEVALRCGLVVLYRCEDGWLRIEGWWWKLSGRNKQVVL